MGTLSPTPRRPGAPAARFEPARRLNGHAMSQNGHAAVLVCPTCGEVSSDPDATTCAHDDTPLEPDSR